MLDPRPNSPVRYRDWTRFVPALLIAPQHAEAARALERQRGETPVKAAARLLEKDLRLCSPIPSGTTRN